MNLFSLEGKNAIIPGGSGVLGTAMAKGLAEAGANVAVCGLRAENAVKVADGLKDKVRAKGYSMNVMDLESIKSVCVQIKRDFKSIDILVNAVGGNMIDATTSETLSFFDLSKDALQKVLELNLLAGVILPSQVFGREMAESANGGAIINISSMNYYRPLTRTPGYSAAKAAVSNFTQWLAVDMAQNYGSKIRVNAIAPGFFLTDQNRYLLTNQQDGSLTERGKKIVQQTPMGKFGLPDDLIGCLIWLASDASKFVTGVTIPVDGGFSAYSGV